MRKQDKLTLLLVLAIAIGVAGCSKNESEETTTASETSISVTTSEAEPEITELTVFRVLDDKDNNAISDDNEICDLIASRTNCVVREVDYSDAISDEEELSIMIENGNVPDLIFADNYFISEQSSDASLMGNDGLLVPWDDYIEKYPNIKELFTDKEWDSFRQEDGHIYWADVSGRIYGEEKTTMHYEYAFWIQARVLEWGGYPQIDTLDEYFDLLERYAAANPTMPDGTDVIPYTVLCEDWRYYSIESAPYYLDGYYNCGMIAVNEEDPDNPYIVDYNVTSTAQSYYQKLNEVYNAGFMDKDFDTQTYSEYIEKLSTGRVLGMADYYWNFGYSVDPVFEEKGLKETGCDYVPLALVMNEGQSSQYHLYTDYSSTVSYGLAVTTKCSDPDKAFKFINDLLDQEIHDLRFWGVEGVDYLVDENGLFYRTEEMRANWADPDYKENHCCEYSFMPNRNGISKDGINSVKPEKQTSEYFASISEPLARCLEAYGATGYADMLHSDKEYRPGIWYPLYGDNLYISDELADDAMSAMDECKHEWLPVIIKSTDYEASWEQYMAAYNSCNPQAFVDYAQGLLDERVGK